MRERDVGINITPEDCVPSLCLNKTQQNAFPFYSRRAPHGQHDVPFNDK
jgi:hypothetical protein